METLLAAKAAIQIQKPAEKVFDAIVNPDKMQHYFAYGSAQLESGKTVEWSFPEFSDKFPVVVKEAKKPTYISFDWSGGMDNRLVDIKIEAQDDGSSVVRVEEKSMKFTKEGVQQAMSQTEGWANFLACLKAYLEYGISLRKGAFDFLKK